MYPTVVIILVETQLSKTDVFEIRSSNASGLAGPVASGARSATLGHLSFAVGPVHSTTDNEAGSQCSRHGGQDYGLEDVILELKDRHVGTSG